jgi:S-(hydroxymethyl)glutathione dehydrogenase/alcohol dehydrogenase
MADCDCGSSVHIYQRDKDEPVYARRTFLTQGVAAAVAGGAALLAPGLAGAQAPAAAAPGAAPPPGTPPVPTNFAAPNFRKGVVFWGAADPGVAPEAVLAERQGPTKSTGMKFNALVRHGTTLTTERLTLLPIHPLQVVVRVQAVQTCYSSVGQLITTNPQPFAVVAGHGGVGIVEEVGRLVKRVKVGDQVIMATTPQCGVCQNCMENRADLCNTRLPAIPSATMPDGTPVYMTAPPMGPAGYSEIIVLEEDWVVPVFTKVPPAELAILSCVGGTGLGLAMCRFPVEPGAEVAMFGLGPIGLSAVQGARIQGAKVIIGIDPIRYRRELALKLGATHVLDSNEFRGNALVDKLRELTPDIVQVGRRYAGERAPGPKYVLEAVGGTRLPLPPTVESPYDMSGVEALQQAWQVTRSAGYVRTSSIGHPAGATVSFPAGQWALASKTHVPGNYAGVQAMRDLPRFVKLVEQGLFDAKSLVGRVFRPDRMREAVQVTADRSAVTTIIDFS